MSSVINENHPFQGVDGLPIVDGYIHIGARTQDPTLLANKITIYSDRDLTTALANPQRTDSFGKSVNKIWIPGKYSIVATDIDGNQKYSDLDAGELPGTGVTRCENTQGTNDIIVDAVPTITVLVDTQLYVFRAANTNTGAMTLQIDTTTQYPIKKQHDTALVAGDLEADQTVVVAFNEADLTFELISSPLVLSAVDFNVSGDLTVQGTIFTGKGSDIDDTDVDGSNILTLPLDGNTYDFSGTQQVDEIATTGQVGTEIQLVHTSARQLTHHATDLILKGENDITTADGDISRWVEYAAGDWRMTNYQVLAAVDNSIGWTSPTTLGSGLTITGASSPALTAMIGNVVAYIDATNESLQLYSHNGTVFAASGSGLTITGAGAPALAATSGTDVAYIDSLLESLQLYRHNGTVFAAQGSGLTIAGIGNPALAAMGATDVALIGAVAHTLQMYRHSGTSFSALGSSLAVTGSSTPSLTAMSATDVAHIDAVSHLLQMYRFNYSTLEWSAVGSALTITGAGTPRLAAVNSTDVALVDDLLDVLRMYHHDGSVFAQVGNSLSISSVFAPALTAINGTDLAYIDSTNDSLRLYRFGFFTGDGPYRPF